MELRHVSCSCAWANEKGSTAGDVLFRPSEGDIEADPRFCDPTNGDLELQENSPCLAGVHGGRECGRMGAFDAACGDSPVEISSWGRIKFLYKSKDLAR